MWWMKYATPLSWQLQLCLLWGMHHSALSTAAQGFFHSVCGLWYSLEALAWQIFNPVSFFPISDRSAGRQLRAWAAMQHSACCACGISAMLLALAHSHVPCLVFLEAIHFRVFFVSRQVCPTIAFFMDFAFFTSVMVQLRIFWSDCSSWCTEPGRIQRKVMLHFLEFDYFYKVPVMILFRT